MKLTIVITIISDNNILCLFHVQEITDLNPREGPVILDLPLPNTYPYHCIVFLIQINLFLKALEVIT